MSAAGAGGESTGGHCRIGNLDDIIGANTIEDSGMPKVRRWMGSTVLMVVHKQDGWLRAQGTHWDQDDIYTDWRSSGDWDVNIRAYYEKDGEPDINGDPQWFTRKQIEAIKKGMTDYEFSCQGMNNPLPDSERLWHEETCEHRISIENARKHPGRIFVLSDPAPRGVGSLSGKGEAERKDSSKGS